jgi:hypothetical protein
MIKRQEKARDIEVSEECGLGSLQRARYTSSIASAGKFCLNYYNRWDLRAEREEIYNFTMAGHSTAKVDVHE